MRRALTFLMSLFVLSAAPAFAAGEPLTDELIQGYAASIPEVDKMMEKYKDSDVFDFERQDFEPQAGQDWSPISTAAKGIKNSPASGEFLSVIREHGFGSIDQWGSVGDRITRAMVAIEVAKDSPNAEAEMNRALAELEANEDLSPEQKQMMRGQLEMAMGVMRSVANAPAADVEAVRPHMPRLKNLMED
ncbi:MAG: hypothetical protein P8080_09665 [Gammaproteobacteria bacterium]